MDIIECILLFAWVCCYIPAGIGDGRAGGQKNGLFASFVLMLLKKEHPISAFQLLQHNIVSTLWTIGYLQTDKE